MAITANKLQLLFVDLGKRYRTYIENGNVIIRTNTIPCVPEKIKWAKGYPEKVDIATKFGNVHGLIGLMVEGSQKGLYGLDLFRKNRLIKPFVKFGIPEHPTVATIMGNIHLDFVPVTHEKNKFIEDSVEWEEAEKACQGSDVFKKIIKEARKTHSERAVNEKTDEKTNNWLDAIAKASRLPELKDMMNPNTKNKEKESNGGKGEEKMEIEKRDKPIEPKKEEVKDPESQRERKPKKTHEVVKHVLTIFGRTFQFKHEWFYDLGQGRKDYKQEKDGHVTIFTNTAFPAFSATKDKPFYAAINIVEVIAEIYIRGAGLGIDKMNEAKDMLLKQASIIKNQIEEEKVEEKASIAVREKVERGVER